MDFLKALHERPYFLYDAPMETRIEYDTHIQLDKEMSIFTLVFTEEGKTALKKLYLGDIAIAERYDMPIIINAPTYRANPAHCKRLGIAEESIPNINLACVEFVKGIRDSFIDFKSNIFITAPIGPRLAGYEPDFASDLAFMTRFYSIQADALVDAKVDSISIAAMPSLVEALGSATAVANTGIPYSVGFILTCEGTLLDGTPLGHAIEKIDHSTKVAPNFYVISCTHPKTAAEALNKTHSHIDRIKGIKANGSDKSPRELLKLNHAEADEPSVFAQEIISLGMKYNFKVYGGCCGTNSSHLEAIAQALTQNKKQSL